MNQSFQGGNTGLVGGSVPVFDEVVVSTELMTEIETIDSGSGVAVCQSGVVLDSLDQALAEHGLMVPLDLGAKVMIMTLDCCVSCEMFASLERNKLN